MKLFNIVKICFIASFFVPYQEEVSGQALYPMYGGAPIAYDNHGDDDLGLLLTVLLLAARNRNSPNCNCCNCCNCGGGQKSIPVPYPIPFPTNNPIINNKKPGNNDNASDESATSKQVYKDQQSFNYTLSYVPVPVEQRESQDYGS